MIRLTIIGTLIICIAIAMATHLLWALCWGIARCLHHQLRYAPWGWTSIGLIAAVLLMMAYGAWVGRWQLEVTHHDYSHASVPKAFEGYRIVHISDLHLGTFEGHPDKLERIVETINQQHPDLICFTGDMVGICVDEALPHLETLRRLQARDGICSVLGNHDFFIYSRQYASKHDKAKALQRLIEIQTQELGWRLLRNESMVIERSNERITIIGVDNSSCRGQGFHTIHKGDLRRAMRGTEGMRILLSHDPTQWEAEVLTQTDIPLTLSGHTHAAQIRIGGWTPAKWTFHQTDGMYNEHGQSLYVNIGLGCTAPLRIGAEPEITVLTLHTK